MPMQQLREGLEPGHEPAQLLAWLFLGDRFSARNVEWMKANKIGYVLQLNNVPTPDAMVENFKAAVVEYKRLPAEDVETDNIILQFPEAVAFIERAFAAFKSKSQERSNVLVRFAGVHRMSAARCQTLTRWGRRCFAMKAFRGHPPLWQPTSSTRAGCSRAPSRTCSRFGLRYDGLGTVGRLGWDFGLASCG